MDVFINDQKYSTEQALSLSELFTSLHLELTRGVAVAVNNIVIPRSGWDTYTPAPGDKIILIKATQGG